MVSLKDIANECNISMTQVSRALNNRNDVSEKTKKRVSEIAEKLGYVKNINASILATNDSNQLAVIINGIDEDHNSEPSIIFNVMKGINRYAKENGYEAVIYLNEDPRLNYMSFCRQRGIKGVILFGVNFEDDTFKAMMASDFPCVVIDIPVEGTNKGCVVINNMYYAKVATEHMIGRGRKQLAMLSGHGHSMVEIERRMGFEIALERNGLSVRKELIINANFDLEKAYVETKKLIQTYPEVDGIFCASDFMALGALKALNELGKKVPDTISIFGFDGIILGEHSSPTISTIKQDNVQKGYSAAKLLDHILSKSQNEYSIVVPCKLVIRESA